MEMELTAHVAGLRDQGVLGTPGSDGHMPVASILARHEMRRAATFDHSVKLPRSSDVCSLVLELERHEGGRRRQPPSLLSLRDCRR